MRGKYTVSIGLMHHWISLAKCNGPNVYSRVVSKSECLKVTLWNNSLYWALVMVFTIISYNFSSSPIWTKVSPSNDAGTSIGTWEHCRLHKYTWSKSDYCGRNYRCQTFRYTSECLKTTLTLIYLLDSRENNKFVLISPIVSPIVDFCLLTNNERGSEFI